MPQTYAAASSTPNGTLRQPQSQTRASSDSHLHPFLEDTKAAPSSGRSPRSEHRPNTANAGECVYVLTLKITGDLSRPMNELRERYFPQHLNRTPAHLTLFHALPHSQYELLEAGLSQTSSGMKTFLVSTGKPFRMRRGFGVNVDAGYQKMKHVHGQLRAQWLSFLSDQDAGRFQPHWTVMNKVDDKNKVDNAFDAVRNQLLERCQAGQAIGLDLWRYKWGKWEWANEYRFNSPRETPSKIAGSGIAE
ncbi:uncharacterized protein K460DRAFT_366188 [Cucurbitaria berberidis CBS 394.84]|uniref:2'-5' RNA ligase superfamily-domain-containing protein n=1 Tax=Cucurbitaria berberidis CBS 394.84 TaxID=1168544 RepID=A0A9P4GGU7_9PLEO|nr:uncharacterized protein K460DRAFT_366188 [Cucurbitaria berberidis CBS 394.84]KAF1845310.1 hypothetical protein K460DRAFT_366188 [Cucurbitaria berberidis CBS 394.84]